MTLDFLIARGQAILQSTAAGVATAVEIRRASGEVVALNAPLEILHTNEPDERGGLQTIELAKLFVPAGEFDQPLGVGDRMCVDRTQPSYTFLYAGNQTKFGQTVTFQRQASPARGPRSNRPASETGKPKGGR